LNDRIGSEKDVTSMISLLEDLGFEILEDDICIDFTDIEAIEVNKYLTVYV